MIKGFEVRGLVVDGETRCEHYATERDIIAIKFYCCKTYYPCYQCHASDVDHGAAVWPTERFDELAILCGACGTELTIRQYLACQSTCPHCQSKFNPGCSNHYHLYFEK